MKTGKLIVIEGASDGIGKSTQLQLLQDHLKADGIKIATHHFPTYYSYQCKSVEKYLAGEYGEISDLSPYFINSLYAHDRAITWLTKLKPLYEKGRTILLDRYTTSSIIYQTAPIEDPDEKRDFINYVIDYEYHKLGIHEPDAVIFLEAPFELITKMREQRSENEGNITNDIYERNLEILQKAYQNAIFAADHLGWTKIKCATPDGSKMRTPQDIHEEIYQKLQKLLSL